MKFTDGFAQRDVIQQRALQQAYEQSLFPKEKADRMPDEEDGDWCVLFDGQDDL